MCAFALVPSSFAAALSLPAAAASLDPKTLDLQRADVPAGFRLVQRGELTNAADAKSDKRLPRLYARWGRATGYAATFVLGDERGFVNSRADLFRDDEGARAMLAWVDREGRRSSSALDRRRVAVGTEGWMYTEAANDSLVIWSSGRVFAWVVAEGVPGSRTLGLARLQQRRIAAALR